MSDNVKENLTKRKYISKEEISEYDLCGKKCPFFKTNKCDLYKEDLLEWMIETSDPHLRNTGYYFRTLKCIDDIIPDVNDNVVELLKETNRLLNQILKKI